jgi:hypothetical protein
MFFVSERRRTRRRLSAIRARDVREDGGSQANVAGERSEHRTQRAPASEAIKHRH